MLRDYKEQACGMLGEVFRGNQDVARKVELGLESLLGSDLHTGLRRCDSKKGESFVSALQQARGDVERLSALDKAACATARGGARSDPRLSHLRSEPRLQESASSCEDQCQRLSPKVCKGQNMIIYVKLKEREGKGGYLQVLFTCKQLGGI